MRNCLRFHDRQVDMPLKSNNHNTQLMTRTIPIEAENLAITAKFH